MSSKKSNEFPRGKVNAVDCEGCTIQTDGVYVAALGLKNISIRVKDGVVEVRKRREGEEW